MRRQDLEGLISAVHRLSTLAAHAHMGAGMCLVLQLLERALREVRSQPARLAEPRTVQELRAVLRVAYARIVVVFEWHSAVAPSVEHLDGGMPRPETGQL